MNSPAISVIGLGKLGSPMVACFASKGFQVVGVDVNTDFVAQVGAGNAPVFEPQLQEMLSANKARIKATTQYEQAILETDITCVIVPTPSDERGIFSLKYLLPACEAIGQALKKKNRYHLVVITSTVMPGHTSGPILQSLEKSSGKKANTDFGLCYSPEFIALGSVIRDFLHPDMVLIGEQDARAGQMLEDLYRKTVNNSPNVARMSLVNAELTKISVNTYVTTKITFSNMLARICERLPGADVDVVTQALGFDTRIGGKYLKGAVGYGGPCFPRDNKAFAVMAREIGANPALAEATDQLNRFQIEELFQLVTRYTSPRSKVAILGLSYKPNTDVIEESHGIELARRLAQAGHAVSVADPAALENAKKTLGSVATCVTDFREALHGASVVVHFTPWKEFSDLSHYAFEPVGGKSPVIVDCWRSLNSKDFGTRAQVVALGRSLK